MKIAIIFHSADMDGLMSGTLAKKTFEIINECFPGIFEYDLIGYNYGKNSKEDIWLNFEDNHYDYYQFIDVTPPLFWLENIYFLLANNLVKIDIFDHHKPVYDEISEIDIFKNNNLIYYFDNEFSGAYIYWINILKFNWINKFLENIEILNNSKIQNLKSLLKSEFDNYLFSNLLELVDSYDTWKWQNNKTKNNFALYLNEFFFLHKNVEDYYNIVFDANYDSQKILRKGKEISEIRKDLSKNIKHLFVTINRQRFVIINDKASIYHIDNIKDRYNTIDNKEYVASNAVIFYQSIDFIDNKINLSIRSLNDNFDCNYFVKSISPNNGGGHKGSAGCQLSINGFYNLINDK
jgi:hypothetical protein